MFWLFLYITTLLFRFQHLSTETSDCEYHLLLLWLGETSDQSRMWVQLLRPHIWTKSQQLSATILVQVASNRSKRYLDTSILHCKLSLLCLVFVGEKRVDVVDTKSFVSVFCNIILRQTFDETLFEIRFDCFGIFSLVFYVSAESPLQRSQLSQYTSVVIG